MRCVARMLTRPQPVNGQACAGGSAGGSERPARRGAFRASLSPDISSGRRMAKPPAYRAGSWDSGKGRSARRPALLALAV
jgi:hypothetical protein